MKLLTTFLFITFAFGRTQAFAMTDTEVRSQIIKESQMNYHGSCPCPENRMRNGRHCGGRSAYSRPGGARPLCYPTDVTPQMIQNYRASHG